jgi:hypothetical protein
MLSERWNAGTQAAWDATTRQPGSVADGADEGDMTMRQAIFAALAILGLSLATAVVADAAPAYSLQNSVSDGTNG